MTVRTTPRTPLHAVLIAPALALFVVVLSACGGSSSKATTTTTAAPASNAGAGGANRTALAAFRACMASHGSPLPTFAPRANNGTPPSSVPDDGTNPAGPGAGANGGGGRGFGGGGGIGNVANSTDPAVQKAFAACQSTLPPGFLQQQQQAQQQRAAFNSCMKDHGVIIPTGPAPTGQPTTTIDRTSPAYTAAYAICGKLLPQRPARTTTTLAAQ